MGLYNVKKTIKWIKKLIDLQINPFLDNNILYGPLFRKWLLLVPWKLIVPVFIKYFHDLTIWKIMVSFYFNVKKNIFLKNNRIRNLIKAGTTKIYKIKKIKNII